MDMEILMQYVTYLMMAIGALSFVTGVIVQAVKEMPRLKGVPTSVVALAVSFVLCPAAVRWPPYLPVFRDSNCLVLCVRFLHCRIHRLSGNNRRMGTGCGDLGPD